MGVYHGYKKPDSISDSLADFIAEAAGLAKDGLLANGKVLSVSIYGIECDTPARNVITR